MNSERLEEQKIPEWLSKHSPSSWLKMGMREASAAEKAYLAKDHAGGSVAAKRASGMALNAVLSVSYRDSWGRTYLEHLKALSEEGEESDAPFSIKQAAKLLLSEEVSQIQVVRLRTPKDDLKVVEATKDILAYAYTVLVRKGAWTA